jgi:hypothetical protein
MRFGLFHPLRFRRLLVLANGVFWIVFGINFVANSYAYRPHPPAFEEILPSYVFASRAFPVGLYMSPLMRITRAVQWPSFRAASPFFLPFNRRIISVNQVYWGISVGGYYLVLVCLLSFLQWYLLGFLIDHGRKRIRAGGARAPGNSA